MTGEKQDLMRLRQLANSLDRVARTFGIEIYEDVVEDNRKRMNMACVFTHKSQTHCQIQLFGGTSAEQLRGKSNAVGALYLNFSAIERSNHADISAIRHRVK